VLSFGRAVGRGRKRAPVTVLGITSGLVVPMVDRRPARSYLRVAENNKAKGDRLPGCFAFVLDGCDLLASAIARATPGLLFDEHVERVRSLDGHGMGEDAETLAPRRRRCALPYRNHDRFVSTRVSELDWGNKRKLGRRRSELDDLACCPTAFYWCLVVAASHVNSHRFVAYHFSPPGHFLNHCAADKTCLRRPGHGHDSDGLKYDRWRSTHGTAVFARRCRTVSKWQTPPR